MWCCGAAEALPDRPSCPEVAGSIALGPGEAPRRGELGFDILPAKMGVPTRKPGNLGTRVATGTRRVTRTVFLLYDWARYRLVSRRRHVRLGPWSKGHIYAPGTKLGHSAVVVTTK